MKWISAICLVFVFKKVITEKIGENDFINFATEKLSKLEYSNLDLSKDCIQQMQFWGWSLINNQEAIWADKSDLSFISLNIS